ncbi:Transmembrane protein 252 [Sciurus carolinensis]|uniref:Transmembrane protein 252 n=1 Tax=Sciurus carolinensis TaxID=30640 RepID=A0AA41ML08_SCICA|nr:Transmembrane protein 252 [Sciurus carolinensis]
MQNRAGLILCTLALLTGFLMICLGAFFISSDSIFHCQRNLIMAYSLLPLGFVILLSGIFWSTYRQASENKEVFSHALRRHLAHGDLPLATVDRPDFYPPAYEESLNAQKHPCPAEGEALDIPPPLYTETGFELQGENDAHPESPPSYQASVATSEDAERPSPARTAGHTLVGISC